MKEIHDNAKELMKGFCRVCKECNGVACAGEVPGMGGLGTAASFKANIESLKQLKFNMRLVHDVIDPDTSTTLLGRRFEFPVFAAPIGGVSFNMGGGISEEDYIRSVINGCVEKGILGCTGDGVPDFIHQAGLEAISSADGQGIPFIKPWEDKELFEKLEKAENSGADTVGIDIDAAGLITLKKMGRPVSPKSVAKLRQIIEQIPMKFILKGVMTKEDALFAVEAGAKAIVVSNHGGRVLDYTPGSAEVLHDIALAVKDKITVLADGGVRTGGDVVKLLALGAHGVMIGRPFSVAAVGGLQNGVETLLDKVKTEIEQVMVLTGCAEVSDIKPSILYGC